MEEKDGSYLERRYGNVTVLLAHMTCLRYEEKVSIQYIPHTYVCDTLSRWCSVLTGDMSLMTSCVYVLEPSLRSVLNTTLLTELLVKWSVF